jgi:hypothetical protein
MIDRQGGHIQICCDACDAIEESERHATFQPFWVGLREAGWRSKEIPKSKAQSDWEHYCPKCASMS